MCYILLICICFHLASYSENMVIFSTVMLTVKFISPHRKNDKSSQDVTWMAINFLNFDDKTTEMMVFGGNTGNSSVDLGLLAQSAKITTSQT